MGNFFAWVLVYAVRLLFIGAFSAAGIALGIALRKKKNKKTQEHQEA